MCDVMELVWHEFSYRLAFVLCPYNLTQPQKCSQTAETSAKSMHNLMFIILDLNSVLAVSAYSPSCQLERSLPCEAQ